MEVGPNHTEPLKPESCPVGNREPWKCFKKGEDPAQANVEYAREGQGQREGDQLGG
jgi:hypothetical protein